MKWGKTPDGRGGCPRWFYQVIGILTVSPSGRWGTPGVLIFKKSNPITVSALTFISVTNEKQMLNLT